MRASLFALVLTLAAVPMMAEARTITPSEAKDHAGENVTVEGVVADVHHAASGNAIFLDMGGRYPDNTFSKETLANFPMWIRWKPRSSM